jgi:hypothetical protein
MRDHRAKVKRKARQVTPSKPRLRVRYYLEEDDDLDHYQPFPDYHRYLARSLVNSPYLDGWQRDFCWSMQFVEHPSRRQLEKLRDIHAIDGECQQAVRKRR